MPKFFFNDHNGNTVGPYNEQQLHELAEQGGLTVTTPMVTDAGHKGFAGQIPGLKFKIAVPQPSLTALNPEDICNLNYYYTDSDGRKQGPINDQSLRALVAQKEILPATPMETEGGYKGMAGQIPDLFPATSLVVQPASSQPVVIDPSSPVAKQIKDLNFYFVTFRICLILSFVPLVGIMGIVFLYVLLYHLWKLIPQDIARTSPGAAVGLCFVPLFNFYWIFVAYKGLGEDMNETLKRRGIQYRVNEGLGKIFCIFTLCFALPLINILLAIPTLIMLTFFLKSVKNGAIALLEHAENESQEAKVGL